jgi:deoxyribodipyrimidine photolyase
VKATRENLPENDNRRPTVFKPGSKGAGVIINRWVPEHRDLEGVSILQTVLFNETTRSYRRPKCSDTQHLRVVVQAWVDLEQEGGEGQFQTGDCDA